MKLDLKKMNYNRDGSLLDFIDDFVNRFPKLIDEYETLLTDNRIWKQRTVGGHLSMSCLKTVCEKVFI